MKESKALKITCYILLPILIGIICLALFYTIYKQTYRVEMNEDYFDGEEFANRFMYALNNEIRNTIYNDNNDYNFTEEGLRVYYIRGGMESFVGLKNCKFVITYFPRGKIYTNINSLDSIPKIEDFIKYAEMQNGEKIHITNGEINTTSDVLRDIWGDYKSLFTGAFYYSNDKYYDAKGQDIKEKVVEANKYTKTEELNDTEIYNVEMGIVDTENVTYVDYTIDDFEIYVSYEEEFNLNSDDMYILNILRTLKHYENILYIAVPICGLLTIIIFWYLTLSIGHEKDKKEIQFNDIDKIPLEIIFAIVFFMLNLVTFVLNNFSYKSGEFYKLFISEVVTAYLVMYTLVAIALVSCVKRIKAKTFLENTITWKILKLLKKILDILAERLSLTIKIAGIVLLYAITMISMLFIFEYEIRIWNFY